MRIAYSIRIISSNIKVVNQVKYGSLSSCALYFALYCLFVGFSRLQQTILFCVPFELFYHAWFGLGPCFSMPGLLSHWS